jgi:hypothetical protein
MITRTKNFYGLMTVFSLLGFVWILLNQFANQTVKIPSVCIFKNVTSLPCPSCGSTRSLISLMTGGFREAFYLNPFGYIIFIFLTIAPIWIFLDYLLKRESLFNVFQLIQHKFQKRAYQLVFILIILSNWIWNIGKGI